MPSADISEDLLELEAGGSFAICGFPTEIEEIDRNFSYHSVVSINLSEPFPDWLYLDILGPSGQTACLVAVPSDRSKIPPTAAILPLAKSLTLDAAGWDANEYTPLPQRAYLLMTEDSWEQVDGLTNLRELVSAHWIDAVTARGNTTLKVGGGFCKNKYYESALKIAVQAGGVIYKKYRYLEYYRVFEHLYMNVTIESLNAAFYQEPKASLQRALDAMSREAEALYQVFEKFDLLVHAEQLAQTIDGLANNKFALALGRKLKRDKRGGSGLREKGVEYAYAIRCAIVHAGARDLIFESFPDADAVLDAIEETVWDAAMLSVALTLA